jgi:hypothetical protein
VILFLFLQKRSKIEDIFLKICLFVEKSIGLVKKLKALLMVKKCQKNSQNVLLKKA